MNEIAVYWIVLGCLAFSAIYFHIEIDSAAMGICPSSYAANLLPHICFFTAEPFYKNICANGEGGD